MCGSFPGMADLRLVARASGTHWPTKCRLFSKNCTSHRQVRAAMIDGGSVVFHVAKSEGAVAQELDLVVHPFKCAVGDADPRPSENAVEMLPHHVRQSLERPEACMACPPEPVLQ